MTTKIEWTQKTWNPIVGCSVVSPGCTNCYAMRMAARLEAMAMAKLNTPIAGPVIAEYPALEDVAFAHYIGTIQTTKAGPVWTGKVALAPQKTLTAPRHWKKPRLVFVNSMGDLFHEDVPDEWIDRVFAAMALCPQHTFQVLTKRSERMREYMNSDRTGVLDWAFEIVADERGDIAGRVVRENLENSGRWPLPNVWKGVSAEDQERANERIPDLLATKAALRFVSFEPLLGPVDLTHIEFQDGWMDITSPRSWKEVWEQDWQPEVTGEPLGESIEAYQDETGGPYPPTNDKPGPMIGWAIVGDESGPNRRVSSLDHARSLRDQCETAGIPFFFKQWHIDGKKVSCPELDGKTHREMPACLRKAA